MSENIDKIRMVAKFLLRENHYNGVSESLLVLCDIVECEMIIHERILQGFYLSAVNRAENAETELKEVETELENLRSNY